MASPTVFEEVHTYRHTQYFTAFSRVLIQTKVMIQVGVQRFKKGCDRIYKAARGGGAWWQGTMRIM